MEPIRTREELEALYDRHVNMVYQICLMLLEKRARRGGRNSDGLSQGDGVSETLS